MSELISCPICEKESSSFLFSTRRFNNNYLIAKCRKCSLVYVNPQPTLSELNSHYSKNYNYSYMQKSAPSKNDKKDAEILEKMKKSNCSSLLDVGCGSGLFVLSAKKHGFKAKGIDLSQKMISYGKNKFNLDLSIKDFLKMNEKFDNITMRHFLEHTKNPSQCIKKAKSLLKKDGLLFIKVPNIESFAFSISGKRWNWLSPPAHLFFFSPKTITKLLEKQGFTIRKIETRRGDSESLLFHLGISIADKLGLWNYLKEKKDREQKDSQPDNAESSITPIINNLGIILSPIEYLLNKSRRGSELVVYASPIAKENS